MMKAANLSIHVHGPHVTERATREVGEAVADALHLVAENLHPGADLHWRVARVEFACDGCGLRQPFEAGRGDWTHLDGIDYCPECSRGPRQAA